MPAPLPPDRARLETLRTYLQLQLAEVEDAIRSLDRRTEPYAIEHIPPQGITSKGRGILHVRGCRDLDFVPDSHIIPATDTMATQALLDTDGPNSMCQKCRPDKQLQQRPQA